MLPIVAVGFAIAGAFASTSRGPTDAFAPKTGYIDAPQPCSIPVQCSTTGIVDCTLNGQQAFGMNLNGTRCDVVLKRP